MTILDRYIARNLASGWLLVLGLLTVVFSLFAFMDELGHATETYPVVQVLKFVALTTPQRMLDLFPVITLLGTLITYASLSRDSELVIIQAVGIPVSRQLRSAAMPAFLLMLLLWPVGEFISAPLYQLAETAREKARSGSDRDSILNDNGLWSSDGEHFYHIGSLSQDLVPADVAVYDFSVEGHLVGALQAERAEIMADGSWRLHGVQIKKAGVDPRTGHQRLVTDHRQTLLRNGFWSAEELTSFTLSPASMSLRDLRNYLLRMQMTGENQGNLQYLFWQRAVLPATAAVMVVLAFQLSRGMLSRRDKNVGLQTGIGVAVSICFYLLSQIIHAAGTLFMVDARLVALAPILVVLCATMILRRYSP
ncbi:MAG: LPS export ABC transporter permease LptG [Gammaproteobacteria bacterium]|nr:MAG: LPS export ABC transporter permease LptG [Gammaproteobacteria bacterium]